MSRYRKVNIAHDMTGKVVLDYDKDVIYIANREEELHLQIIFPMKQSQIHKKYPCIVYLMSSNEKKENIYRNIPRLTQFAQRGYVVALMEQSTNASTYDKQSNLVHSAVQFLAEHADTYNISPKNMFIWQDETHSSNTESTCSSDINYKYNENYQKVKAVIRFCKKEQAKSLGSSQVSEMLPILMISSEQEESTGLEFWTEDAFDVVEDFIDNYID